MKRHQFDATNWGFVSYFWGTDSHVLISLYADVFTPGSAVELMRIMENNSATDIGIQQ